MLCLAIDIDGVCLDFVGALHTRFAQVFGGPVHPNSAQTSWDTGPVFSWSGWKDHGYRDMWDWIREHPAFWGEADPVEGAIGALHELKRAGYWLEAVTDTPPWARPTRWRWFEKHCPPFDAVVFVPSGETKADVSDADVLIDDKPENCLSFVRDGRYAILFTQPWNADYNAAWLMGHGEGRLFRADNWAQVLLAIEAIEMEEAA